ncbi:hypothetical protein RhiirA1_404982, partial [Rhizophagus irregularis]
GEEGEIRDTVVHSLRPHVDHLEVDHYGNVLAQIKKGKGPTILINAHLDTVHDFVEGREILKYDEFAREVESIGRIMQWGRWQTVAGGSSDTRIWAEQGINSVNLSAGYNNEHTSDEFLIPEANYETYEFVMLLIEKSRRLTERSLKRRRNQL